MFLEDVETENYAGFKRGINLASIQSKLNSENIVTKLIVEQNSNQYADNGFCSIQLADLSPHGENVLFNFDYYTHKKLLDADAINYDLYDNTRPCNIGLIPNLHEINKNTQQYVLTKQFNDLFVDSKGFISADILQQASKLRSFQQNITSII
mgnify:CR=1 FL=1